MIDERLVNKHHTDAELLEWHLERIEYMAHDILQILEGHHSCLSSASNAVHKKVDLIKRSAMHLERGIITYFNVEGEQVMRQYIDGKWHTIS